LLTSSRERGVLWDTASGRQLASQPARVENGSGDGLAFSPDGTIAAIAVAGSVHLWSRDGGSLRRLDDPTPRTDDTDTNYLDAVAFSPDGQRLAAVATAHSVSLWSLATAGEPTTLEGAPAYAIQFSSSGHSLIGGGFDDAVQISADDGEVMRRFAAGLTMAASMSPDRRWVTTVDSDRIARVWDTEAGTLALLLDGQITLVPSRDSGPSDRVLSRAGTSLLVLRVLPRDPDTGPEPPRLLGATFLPDGSAIGDTGDLLDRDGVSSRALHVAPRGPPEPLEPGQRRIVTDTVVSGIGPGGHLGHVAASRDGRVVALADFRPQAEVRWWSLPAGRSLGHHALNGAVHDVAVSPDGRWIAATDEHGAVLIDASSRQVLRVVPGAVSVEFTPDGRELITSGEGGTVWRDLVNGETRRTRPEHGRIAVRSDGAVLITGGTCTFVAPGGETLDLDQDSSAQGSLSEKGDLAVIPVGTSGWVWDVRARRPIATLTGHAGVIHQAAFAPDGERVATAGADGTVRVWESRTGRLLQTSATTGGPMIGVAFSPDGTRLLAVALDGPARMLDVHLETREADEVARLVRARGVWQVDDGRLVARTR
jgi:WD40 repeat protein